jgi:hypothetical protein
MDFLAPRACSRKSKALCLFLPVGFRSEEPESRRCDSLSRRCSARSFCRSCVSLSAASPLDLFSCLLATVGDSVDAGILADCTNTLFRDCLPEHPA